MKWLTGLIDSISKKTECDNTSVKYKAKLLALLNTTKFEITKQKKLSRHILIVVKSDCGAQLTLEDSWPGTHTAKVVETTDLLKPEGNRWSNTEISSKESEIHNI